MIKNIPNILFSVTSDREWLKFAPTLAVRMLANEMAATAGQKINPDVKFQSYTKKLEKTEKIKSIAQDV